MACARELTAGSDTRAERVRECRDPRSLMIVEPLRFAFALRSRWVALEQVPAALDLWSLFAELLSRHGYQTAAGILSAERYGVPQTRKRAFLIASLDGPVQLPPPTHRSYDPCRQRTPEHDAGLKPWVSMADALGLVPCAYETRQSGARSRPVSEPAPAMVAARLAKGTPVWAGRRPATTVSCDRRVHPPGHKQNASDPPGRYEQRRGVNAIRVTVEQAATLQGFRPGYPWQGARTRQFEQVGNAVPPPLAHRVLEQAMAASIGERGLRS
jgi:DNA (cytosine-5)-methyltransferase 1